MSFVIGFETSCDETAVGIVESRSRKLLADVLSTQIPLHAPYFGVVPELASRAHLEKIHDVLEKAVKRSGIRLRDASAVAYTQGPGLKGSLLVGETVAKSLAFALGKPAIGVHHLEAHLASILFERRDVRPPFVGLVVSGGHTDLVHVKQWGRYRVLGRTLDDACGEAFDKFSKILGLGYPGGPLVDRLARKGDPEAVPFPYKVLEGSFSFSFSGLKTSALYWVRDHGINEGERGRGGEGERKKSEIKLNHDLKRKAGISLEDLCASYQEAICRMLLNKTRHALFALKLKRVVVSGGVAANSRLRFLFHETGRKEGWQSHFPRPRLCTDNGAMIALVGALKLEQGAKLSAPFVDSTLPFTRW